MPIRCLYCSCNHETLNCPLSKLDLNNRKNHQDLKCSNCVNKHAANNLECSKRAEFINIRKKLSSNNVKGKSANIITSSSTKQYQGNQNFPLLPAINENRVRESLGYTTNSIRNPVMNSRTPTTLIQIWVFKPTIYQ